MHSTQHPGYPGLLSPQICPITPDLQAEPRCMYQNVTWPSHQSLLHRVIPISPPLPTHEPAMSPSLPATRSKATCMFMQVTLPPYRTQQVSTLSKRETQGHSGPLHANLSINISVPGQPINRTGRCNGLECALRSQKRTKPADAGNPRGRGEKTFGPPSCRPVR